DRCFRMIHAETDRVGRPPAIRVEGRDDPLVALRVLVQVRHGRVFGRVTDDQHLAGRRDGPEDAIETNDDLGPLAVGGNDDRDVGRHTRTPSPRRFQISITGTVVSSSAYCLWGEQMTRRSDSCSTTLRGTRSGSIVT